MEKLSNLYVTSYLISWDKDRLTDITIIATKSEDDGKPISWAVRNGSGCMSNKTGEFEYEPRPSSRDRDDEFFEEYRFASPEQAYETYLKYHS